MEPVSDEAAPPIIYEQGSWGPTEANELDRAVRSLAQSGANSGAPMTNMHDLIFLFYVDNTLLDNDRVEADLAAHLTEVYGADAGKLYWAIFEQLRQELGYADLPRRIGAVPASKDARSKGAEDVKLARRLSFCRPALCRRA